MTDTRFDSLANMAPVVRCHEAELIELTRRVRHIEKQLDTRNTNWLKRLWFWIDGWPRWTIVAERRSWRPWH